MPTTITYTKARERLAKLLDEVSFNREIVIINRRNAENVALISENELNGILETAHLLRSPKNARRLIDAIISAKKAKTHPQTLEQLKKEFGINE